MSGMPPIPSTFQTLVERLEMTEAQRAEADRQQLAVRERLQQRLSLDRGRPTFLTGSFARGTAIRKLKDIDLFAVLDPDEYAVLLAMPPLKALSMLHQVLDQMYPNKRAPITQDHTVRVDFVNSGTIFEVVPALPRGNGIYAIPQKTTSRWIESSPDAHAAILREANRRTSGAASVMVKLAKHFKRVIGDRGKIASFHLEMMICELLVSRPADYPTGLRDLFIELGRRVQRPFPDPAKVGPDVDERLTLADRNRLTEVFDAAADQANRAIELAPTDLPGAHWLWRDLLGDIYPEKGRKPASRPLIVPAPAIDEAGSRFG